MTAAEETIHLTYRPELAQIADYIAGSEHQAYENYRMIYDRSWDRYFNGVKTDAAVMAAFAAAAVYSFSLPLLPGAWSVLGYWIFAPAPAAGLAVWLILRHGARQASKHSNLNFARWNIENEQMYSTHYDVEIGPFGFRQTSRTDTVELTWSRYHVAILQPDNLVLVFHGTVAVIPHDILPIPAKDLVEKIHDWSVKQSLELTPVS